MKGKKYAYLLHVVTVFNLLPTELSVLRKIRIGFYFNSISKKRFILHIFIFITSMGKNK